MRGRGRAAACGAAVLLLLAACGNRDPSSEAVRESVANEITTSTTAPPGAAASTSTTGRSATTSTKAPPTTRAATGSSTTATTPAGRRALAPAAPGTYRYDTSGRATFAGTTVTFPAVTTLVVDVPSGTRQRATRNLRDASGNGIETEFNLDYRAEGVFLLSLRLTTGFSGFTDIRELRPASPVLLLPTGARPGAHVEADLTGTSTAKLVVEVLGEQRLTIGGQPVDTLVVRVAVTLGPGDVTGRQELTLNVDLGSRLWVMERSVADASAARGLVTLHSEYTATLQRR